MMLPLLILAATATTSADPIREAVKQKVDAEVAAIKNTVTRKAYVGQIKNKSDLTLTILNQAGENRTANLTTDATIKLASGADGTAADVKVNDHVIAMGDTDGAGVMTVKRLVQITKPEVDTRKVIFGTVSKVSSTSITMEDNTVLKITTTASELTPGSKILAVTRGATALLVKTLK